MQTSTIRLLRNVGLVASSALALSTLHAQQPAATPDKDALPIFENYLTLAAQGNWVSGDKAAFQAATGTTKKGFGGIADYQLSKDLKNDFTLKADGHALLGNADYLAHINLAKDELGSVDIGFKHFRTFYDNAGGFFLPTTGTWLPVFTQELHVDRAKFWAQAKVTLPNLPVFTLRYSNELRSGAKDSTIWGASDLTGISVTTTSNANLASRFIAPSYIEMNERHEILEASASHTLGRTALSLTFQADTTDNASTRYFDRYPGQLRFPLFATSGNIRNFNNQVSGTHSYGNESESYAAIAKVSTALTTRVTLHGAFKYQTSDADFTEDRRFNTYTPYPTAAPVNYALVPTANIKDLKGTASIDSYTATLGADLKLLRHLVAEVGLKYENREVDASETYQTVSATVNTTGVVTVNAPLNRAAASDLQEKSFTPEISLRYTGIAKLSLYGTAERKYLDGDERVFSPYDYTNPAVTPTITKTQIDEAHDQFTLGANWSPLTLLTLRAEAFVKDHQNDFQNAPDSTTALFRLSYEVKGTRLTATVKPIPTLSFTSRYVYQTGEMHTASTTRALYQSGDTTVHQFGQTINWNPIKQFYAQADLNVVFDTLSTAYPRAGNGLVDGNGTLRNADNNYWTGSLLTGFVIDEVTDAQIQYTHYKADNYEPALLATALPYGAGQTDHTFTIGAKRKLSDTVFLEGKVGYLKSTSDTTGGRTDYKGFIAYVGLQQAF